MAHMAMDTTVVAASSIRSLALSLLISAKLMVKSFVSPRRVRPPRQPLSSRESPRPQGRHCRPPAGKPLFAVI